MSTRRGDSRQIVLIVEGHTERDNLSEFLHRWLDPRLPEGGKIGLTVVGCKGISDYLDDVARKTELHLTQRTASYVFGLVDLYGLPPSRVDLSRCHSVAEKVKAARSRIRALIPAQYRDRFRQHFAVHEVEAWLLAYPKEWPQEIRGQITKRPPEEVDFDEPPAKFLKRLLGGRYKKTVRARNIFSTVDPAAAIQACPHLRQLAEDLLRVARALRGPIPEPG